MEMIRTIYVPLTSEPEVLFGLRLSQLPWLAGSGLADVAVWHGWEFSITGRLVAMASLAVMGILLATARIQDVTLPEWFARYVMFRLKPHLYLP